MSRLRRSHGPGPLWIRVMRDRALLMLDVDDVRRVLEGSPDPFAADPPAKRTRHGPLPARRADDLARRAVGGAPALRRGGARQRRSRPTGSADRFVAVTAEEIRLVIDEVERDEDGVLGYEAWHRAFRRIVRRIVLGDGARDDEELSDLLGELMSRGQRPAVGALRAATSRSWSGSTSYVARAEKGSLAGLFARRPDDRGHARPPARSSHWLFAMQDTRQRERAAGAGADLSAIPTQRALRRRRSSARAGADGLASGKGVAGLALPARLPQRGDAAVADDAAALARDARRAELARRASCRPARRS